MTKIYQQIERGESVLQSAVPRINKPFERIEEKKID